MQYSCFLNDLKLVKMKNIFQNFTRKIHCEESEYVSKTTHRSMYLCTQIQAYVLKKRRFAILNAKEAYFHIVRDDFCLLLYWFFPMAAIFCVFFCKKKLASDMYRTTATQNSQVYLLCLLDLDLKRWNKRLMRVLRGIPDTIRAVSSDCFHLKWLIYPVKKINSRKSDCWHTCDVALTWSIYSEH